HKGRPSLLGAISGVVAGLVGITPAAGLVSPAGALAIGAICGALCVWGVGGLKRWLRADDALDVFGIHAVGGMAGAMLTGIFNSPVLGGPGNAASKSMLHQLWIQLEGVLVTTLWCAAVAVLAYYVADRLCGLRVSTE